jgi:hypothetical protein
MWSNGAVVVIKRGDAAIADILENGYKQAGKHAKKTTVEDIKTMERNYTIMRESRNAKMKKAMADNRVKYCKRVKPTPKPILYLEIGYAMAVCGLDAVCRPFAYGWQKLANKTNYIMKKLRNF